MYDFDSNHTQHDLNMSNATFYWLYLTCNEIQNTLLGMDSTPDRLRLIKPRLPDDLRQRLIDQCEQARANRATRKELSRLAAFGLTEAGLRPTVALVREITNLGANDAIARDLEEIRLEIASAVQRQGLKLDLPPGLAEMAEGLMTSFWKASMQQATATFDDEREAIKASRDEVIQANRDITQSLTLSNEENSRLQASLEDERKEKTVALEKCSALQAQSDEVRSMLAKLQEQLVNVEAARQRDTEQFSRDLTLLQERHERDLQVSAGQRRYELQQLDASRENERNLKERIQIVEADRNLQVAQHKTALNTIRDQFNEMTLNLGLRTGEVNAMTAEQSRLSSRVKHLEELLFEAAAANPVGGMTRAEALGLEAAKTKARNLASVFELCDLKDWKVEGRLAIDTRAVQLFLVSEENGDEAGPFDSPDALDAHCESLLEE